MSAENPQRPSRIVQGEVLKAAAFQPVNDNAVHSVTSARTPLSQEQKARTRRYLIQMAIRTICFVAAVVAFSLGTSLWVVWALIGGAVVLPYVAVVMANAGRENDPALMEAAAMNADRIAAQKQGKIYDVRGDKASDRNDAGS
ncbi:MAG: DUF3099 domain-containing protein [Actinomycetia bacterium]|nr:DUF3099 domain-containing protein [Actinomycetes bacterium]